MAKEELKNYIPKGDLEGFPKEIIAKMLDCQEEQGNKRDVTIFEDRVKAIKDIEGFSWSETKEGFYFWDDVINYKNFDLFFERYPKKENQDNSHEFRVGDKVYDILLKEVGVVQDIVYSSSTPYGLKVEFKSGVKSYTTNGCYMPDYKNPQLLHYQDGYDYNVIDFDNLPKRQKPKRWRAKEGWTYYSFTFDFKVADFYDTKRPLDDKAYNSGNYFQTKEEAQEVADKLNKYFQKIIKREGKTYYSFTSNFEVEDFYDDDDIFDKKTYKLGNYFKTKEEAQEVADKLNTYFKQLIQEEHENEINQI